LLGFSQTSLHRHRTIGEPPDGCSESIETHADAVHRVVSQAARARDRTQIQRRVLTPSLIKKPQFGHAASAAHDSVQGRGGEQTSYSDWVARRFKLRPNSERMESRTDRDTEQKRSSSGYGRFVSYHHGSFDTPLAQRHKSIRALQGAPNTRMATHSQFYGSYYTKSDIVPLT